MKQVHKCPPIQIHGGNNQHKTLELLVVWK